MPYAFNIRGTNTLLAGCYPFSWWSEFSCETSLYRENKQNTIDFDADDLSFVPTETGKYYFEYKATDDNGNVLVRTVNFEIFEEIEDIKVSFKTNPETAKIGSLYYVPEIEISDEELRKTML